MMNIRSIWKYGVTGMQKNFLYLSFVIFITVQFLENILRAPVLYIYILYIYITQVGNEHIVPWCSLRELSTQTILTYKQQVCVSLLSINLNDQYFKFIPIYKIQIQVIFNFGESDKFVSLFIAISILFLILLLFCLFFCFLCTCVYIFLLISRHLHVILSRVYFLILQTLVLHLMLCAFNIKWITIEDIPSPVLSL